MHFKNRFCFIGLFLLFSLGCPWASIGSQLTLLLSTTNTTVTAQRTAWLNLHALNPTPTNITWRPPGYIKAELRAGSQQFRVSLHPAESASVEPIVIPGGSFAICPYTFNVPGDALGEFILEFPDRTIPAIVLNVAPFVAVEPAPAPSQSAFIRWLRDAEAEGSPKAFHPTRFFQEHISGHEPFYFIAGTESPNAKFQISFKYQLFNSEGRMAQKHPSLDRFHVAYTQTSLWDWNAASAPFFDSSYRPEFLYAWENVGHGSPDNPFHLHLQAGIQHESNGRDGLDSRSLNIAYVRPTFVFGEESSLQLTLQPRAWVYLPDLEDNPDLPDYRGYVDLRTIVGWRRGLQVSALTRLGDTADRGSIQLDLTYPMMRFFYSNFSLYLHAQYFTGYGESLLRYDERSSVFRVGFSMYR